MTVTDQQTSKPWAEQWAVKWVVGKEGRMQPVDNLITVPPGLSV